MSFSYKPVLLKAIFDHIDSDGKVRVIDIVNYFIDFYEERKENGYDSIYCVDVSDPNNIVLLMESSRQSEMTGERGLGTVQGVDAKLYSSAFEAFETEGSKAADETFFQQLHVTDFDVFYYMAYKPGH